MGKEKIVMVMKDSITKKIPESLKKDYIANGWIELKTSTIDSYDNLHNKYNK